MLYCAPGHFSQSAFCSLSITQMDLLNVAHLICHMVCLMLPSAVDNQHMLHYIRDKTAVPYFSNLVWFIGSHVIELDKCVQTDEE